MSTDLPSLVTAIPGPRSRELARDLRRYESPNVTYVDDRFPVFWESASGALVQDVDGNVFLDLSAAFGVAGVGHCNPRVVEAIQRQAGALIHAMGDVHPSRLKVELARKLADLAPGDLCQIIFGSDGSDAVEAALKTAVVATGKPGVLAFEGGYHGLGYGALDATSRDHFRRPFLQQLGRFTSHVPYPNPYRSPWPGRVDLASTSLETVEAALSRPGVSGREIGAVITEPIQGRGGLIVPPEGWFRDLVELCHRHGALLIADEIFTGCGRTGEWFASEVPPDLLCIGKALGGGFPISACIGSAALMGCWGESTGEAIHTSTFLGSPLGCAAALASLKVIEEDNLLDRCRTAGVRLKNGLQAIQAQCTLIGDVRGRGLMLGIELVQSDGVPHPTAGVQVMLGALQRGLIVLPAGLHGNVIELVPPYIISDEQIDFALSVMEEVIGQLVN